MSTDPFEDLYRTAARNMLPDMPEAEAVEQMRNLHKAGAFKILYGRDGKPNGFQMAPGVMRERAAQREVAEVLGRLTMQKKAGTSLHNFRDAIARRDLANFEALPTIQVYTAAIDEIRNDPLGVFVVEHDWAGAFANAEIGEAPEFKLPYPVCCFEFKLSGHNVCAILSDARGLTIAIETARGWLNIDPALFPDAEVLRKFVIDQVNAILVAIDAQVVETSVVDPPAALNKSREKRGRPPLSSYHIVRLARDRIGAETVDGVPSERKSPRLHFRRGHWRTTEQGRIWINWTLVGDPDLGFIDKHYRL